MLRFQSPLWLALLALAPLALWSRRSSCRALSLPTLAGLKTLRSTIWVRTRWIVPALETVALALMIVALARPQLGARQVEKSVEGINLVLAIDASDTMAALDLRRAGRPLSRLEAVKAVALAFVARRSADRIGLVVFGSNAYTGVPLTTDHRAVATAVGRLAVGAAGPATALGDALGIAVKRVREPMAKSRVVVLLSDGRSNAGALEPLTAARVARELGIRVYAVAVGTRGPAPFFVEDPIRGRQWVYRRVDADLGTLKAIASETGGLFFDANRFEDLERVGRQIDALEKSKIRVRAFERYRDLYPGLLATSLALLLLAIAASNTRYRETP